MRNLQIDLLLILTAVILISSVSLAHSDEVESPTFYSYSGGTFTNRLVSMSFGFFRSLDDNEEDAFYQAVNQAVMYADTGQTVSWFRGQASGTATPVFTWPVNNGYCRRVHIKTYKYNRVRTQAATACFSGNTWRWVRSDK